jgi:HK97 family phage portal protein
LFEKVRKRLANWRNQTETLTLQQLVDLLNLGGASRKEMSEATYFACIRILSESVGKLPLKIMRNMPGGGVEAATKHQLYNVLRYRPNPYQSATAFWNSMEQAKHHDGNAIALIRGAGRKTSMAASLGEYRSVVR